MYPLGVAKFKFTTETLLGKQSSYQPGIFQGPPVLETVEATTLLDGPPFSQLYAVILTPSIPDSPSSWIPFPFISFQT